MSYKLMVFRSSVTGGRGECKEISKQLRNVHAMKLYFKNFEIYRNISIYSQLPPIQYFPGAAAEPLGSARGALRAPRSTGWEPLP